MDLRPVSSSSCPLEVVTPETVARIGRVDASRGRPDDRAADRAVARAVAEGLFEPCREERFEFEFSWRTVGEMAAFLTASPRVKEVTPSYAELEALCGEWRARAGENVRLRYWRKMRLAVYERRAPRVLRLRERRCVGSPSAVRSGATTALLE